MWMPVTQYLNGLLSWQSLLITKSMRWLILALAFYLLQIALISLSAFSSLMPKRLLTESSNILVTYSEMNYFQDMNVSYIAAVVHKLYFVIIFKFEDSKLLAYYKSTLPYFNSIIINILVAFCIFCCIFIMSNYQIYVRKNNGICEKIAISPNSTIQQLKHQVAILTNLEDSSISLTLKGSKLQFSHTETLASSCIPNGAILQVNSMNMQTQRQKDIYLQYFDNTIFKKINENSNIALLRQMVSQLFSIQASAIEFEIRNKKIFNDDVIIRDLELNEGETIKVKDKKIITNLFDKNNQEQPFLVDSRNRIKIVESIASSEQGSEEFCGLNERSFRKQYQSQIVKKKSCHQETSSLKKIDEGEETKFLKRSAIVSKNMCSEFLNSPSTFRNSNKLTNLNEIKQAMSFGSLEDQDFCKEQVQLQIYNELHTKYYKLACMPDCQGWEIKQKISKMERVSVDKIEIGIDEKANIGKLASQFNNLSQPEGIPYIIFKVLS